MTSADLLPMIRELYSLLLETRRLLACLRGSYSTSSSPSATWTTWPTRRRSADVKVARMDWPDMRAACRPRSDTLRVSYVQVEGCCDVCT